MYLHLEALLCSSYNVIGVLLRVFAYISLTDQVPLKTFNFHTKNIFSIKISFKSCHLEETLRKILKIVFTFYVLTICEAFGHVALQADRTFPSTSYSIALVS